MSQTFTPPKKKHDPLFFPSSSQPSQFSQSPGKLSQSPRRSQHYQRSRSLTPSDNSQSQPLTQRRPTWSQESACNRAEEEEDDKKVERLMDLQDDADSEYQGSSQPESLFASDGDENAGPGTAMEDSSDENGSLHTAMEDSDEYVVGLPRPMELKIERLVASTSERHLENFLEYVLSHRDNKTKADILAYAAAKCKGLV